jgi:hypothetical protein
MPKARCLLSLLLLLPLAACGFEAPAPKLTPPPPAPPPPLSTLSASLSISADEIARILNEKTEDHIADIHDQPVKCAIGRCKLTLLATRSGPIEVKGEGDRLALAVPFGMDVDMKLPGFLSMLRAKGDAQGYADASTEARVGPDWQLRTDTSAHVELENSHLKLGPASANLTDMLNSNEEIFARPLSKAIDREITHSVHLREQVNKAWARAFTPIKVGKKPVAWLLLSPERLRVDGPTVSDRALSLTVGIDVRGHVVTQDTPPASVVSPLPPPAPFRGESNRFSFVVPAMISYSDAARLALASLQKKPPHVAGMTLRFTKLALLPSRDDVVVATTFCVDQNWDPTGWFSSCGSGYLRGTPLFDAASETIRIANVHYDMQTEDTLLGAMRALAGPEVGRNLETHLKFNVSRDLAKLHTQVAAALAKPQGRDVTIYGNVESFGQPSLHWTKDGFLALFSATGSVHTDLHL